MVTIDDGIQKTACFCINVTGGTTSAWPEIHFDVAQTNGTPGQVYHLKCLAVPMPQFVSIIPDFNLGNIRLEWTANGQKIQVEKADNVNGPYTALGPVTTDQAYTDIGSLNNQTQSFYRLRQ